MHALVTREITPMAMEASLRLSSGYHHLPGVFVTEILCHARIGGHRLAQDGYEVTQFFDGLHLLIQVMSLDEVKQMGAVLNFQSHSINRIYTLMH